MSVKRVLKKSGRLIEDRRLSEGLVLDDYHPFRPSWNKSTYPSADTQEEGRTEEVCV